MEDLSVLAATCFEELGQRRAYDRIIDEELERMAAFDAEEVDVDLLTRLVHYAETYGVPIRKAIYEVTGEVVE